MSPSRAKLQADDASPPAGRQRRRLKEQKQKGPRGKSPHRIVRRPLSEEERDAKLIHHVHDALQHYNSNHPGMEYDPVKPLMSACAGFSREFWNHINFWARRRDAPADEPVQRFFAELHYDCRNRPTVQTCTILEEPLHRFNVECTFCPSHFEIYHPDEGEFVCGKEGQKLVRLMNFLQKPFTLVSRY